MSVNGKPRQYAPAKFRRIGAERRVATVLFADIVNSSKIVAQQDPEEANEALLSILQSLADIVHEFGGAVVQLVGDGIMALFGAPQPQEDHALMACLAAQAMRDAMARRSGEQIGLRIAIDTGEIVGEVLKAPWWTEYRAVGTAVHLAGKLEKTAPAGGIISTERTVRLVPGRLRTRVHAHNAGTESSGPKILELLEVSASRRTAATLAARRASNLVGRDEPLAVLRHAFGRAQCGRGEAVVIRGEAGVGKSRLVCEFLRTLPQNEVMALECAQLPVGSYYAANPWAAIVRVVLALDCSANQADLRQALYRLVGPGETDALAPPLADLLDLERPPSPAWSTLDPLQRWAATLDALCQTILAAAAARPIVLVCEDFQWADSRTRAVALALAAGIAKAPLLLVVTCRPDEQLGPDWARSRILELQPLSRRDSLEMLRAELGQDPTLTEVEQALVEKSGGNPFFIEESIKALENAGAIEGARGSKRLVGSGALLLPETVQGVLAARIGRLGTEDRRLALMASAIGVCFDVELLAAIARTTKREVLARLNRLCALDFVERTRVVPNVEFRFRHALIQEVAYASLLKRDRRVLHAALLRAVERRDESSLTGRDELLAHHAFHAERWRSVYRYSQRASQSAQASSRYRESERYLEQALAAIEHLADPRLDARRVDILVELARTLSALGRAEDALRRLGEAEALARKHGDHGRLGLVALNRGLVNWIVFRLAPAADAVLDAMAVAEQISDAPMRRAAAARLGGIRVEQGRFAEGIGLLSAAEAESPSEEKTDRPSLAALAASGRRASMARALGELGRFEEAVAVGDEALAIAETTRHAFSFLYAAATLGIALIRKGDFARSVPTLERAWELGQRTHCELLKPLCCGALGFAYLRTGKATAGRELLEQADRYTLGAGWEQWPMAANCIAEASLLLGDRAAAAERAARTIEVARADTAIGELAWAEFILAEALTRGEPRSLRAVEVYETALQRAASLDMAPLAARVHLGLGDHLARLGRLREAEQHRRAAADFFETLGMEFWARALLTAEA
jgi:class 3 adenylate cyclase/tetratricopeptide (TPR) repeat protein